jgi:glycosyltransferase involved in cell wall biosynthesis
MLINKNKHPLVSIIMNCYNGETYIADAVKSILSQTFTNFEVIFWDNQSYDNSALIYKNFKDNRLKYYYSKKHTSLYRARNLAIKKAKGELIAFLDTDDIWLKDKLSLQIEKFKDEKVKLVYSNYYILNQFTGLKKIAYKNKLPQGLIFKELLKNYFLGIGTVIIKKDIFLKRKKFFNQRFNIIGDFDNFIRISKNNYFSCIQHPLSIYRIHNKSFSNKNYEMHIEELKFWVNKNYFLNKNLLSYLKQKILYMEIILNIFNKKYTLSLKMLRKIRSAKKKIKLLLFLIIPNSIFKKIKINFS